MTMTRKQFLCSVVGVGVGAVGVAALAGCGGDDGGGDPIDAPAAGCTTPVAAIGTNHGHTVTVSLADVNAGVDKTYTLTGGGHEHTFSVTAAQFTDIRNGQTRMFIGTGSGHTHQVTVMCGA